MNEANLALLYEFTDRLWLEEGLSRNTLESYRRDLAQFADWLLQHAAKPLLKAERGDIENYLGKRTPVSKPRSISRLVASLRRLYRFALREGRIEIDPTLQLEDFAMRE